MDKDNFTARMFSGSGLAEFAMGKTPMFESAASKPADSAKPPVVEKEPPVTMTIDLAHKMLLEAATQRTTSANLEEAAEAVIEWAQGDDKTVDGLDGFALAIAGIDESTTEEDITDAQADDYNAAWAYFADFLVAAGMDDADVTSLCDDGDDEAAKAVADELAAMPDDELDELVFTFSESGDTSMTEAVVKVVRQGKVVLKRKRIRPRRLNSAQRAALKKARRKANTAGAKIARRKSMKLRAKRIG